MANVAFQNWTKFSFPTQHTINQFHRKQNATSKKWRGEKESALEQSKIHSFTRLPLHQSTSKKINPLAAAAAAENDKSTKIKLEKERKITKKCNFRFWFVPFQSSITLVRRQIENFAQLKTSANWILPLYTCYIDAI